jgi:DNA modification methylase
MLALVCGSTELAMEYIALSFSQIISYLNIFGLLITKALTLRYPKSVLKFNTPKSNDKENRCLHPTQKPLDLMKYLVKTYSNEDDVVMDNCMGSNTTGLACKELNRQYIGIEKDKNYYDVSVTRVLS